MPRFSLVLPTLRRPDTFLYALRTLTNQSYDDFEIVVQNNGRDAETERIIASSADTRIRHFWSDDVLPMSQNWELALANARGDYITFIGDDDGLFPDACRIAAAVIERTEAEIISWRPVSYYWDSHIIPERKNRLIADIDRNVTIEWIESRRQLRDFYNFKLHYSQLPMIYNSFVSRRVTQRVIDKTDRYFLGVTPDVTSGIVNVTCTGQFALLNRALSIAGLSGHSTGHNTSLSPPGWISAQRAASSLGKIEQDPRLVPSSNNLELLLAANALLVRDLLFPQDPETEMNYRRLAQSVASAINDRPGFYDETRRAVEALAAKYQFDVADISLPQPSEHAAILHVGETKRGPSRLLHVIDSKAAQISNVADAVTYVSRLLPSVDDVGKVPLIEAKEYDAPQISVGDTLTFSSAGNGVSALDYGWGMPEAWGTWSVNRDMLLRFAVRNSLRQPIDVQCRMRAFVNRNQPSVEFECRMTDQIIFQVSLTNAGPKTYNWRIPAALIGQGDEIELEFRVKQPRSPAELGLSADTRLLGVGLEWLRAVVSE